jgi:hypothetical protein
MTRYEKQEFKRRLANVLLTILYISIVIAVSYGLNVVLKEYLFQYVAIAILGLPVLVTSLYLFYDLDGEDIFAMAFLYVMGAVAGIPVLGIGVPFFLDLLVDLIQAAFFTRIPQ